jgi:type IV secretory pathway protease TraF
MGAFAGQCPGGEQVWRYSSVTVWRGVCLTRLEETQILSVSELQVLTQKFADAFDQRDFKENPSVRIYRLYTNQDS